MTEIEKIIIVAKFDGWEIGRYTHLPNRVHKDVNGTGEIGTDISNLNYNTSYDALMPVWVKFRDLKTLPINQLFAHSEFKDSIGRAILYNDTPEAAFNLLSRAIIWLNSITTKTS